jgi:hypothetical protein
MPIIDSTRLLSVAKSLGKVYKAADYPLSLLNIIVWSASSVLYSAAYLFFNFDNLFSFNFSIFGCVVAILSSIEVTALMFVLKRAYQGFNTQPPMLIGL